MKYIFALLISIILLFGCKGDPGPSGPLLTGNIAGRVSLYKDNGYRFEDNSGLVVSIEGTSYSTVTLSDGSWKLSGVSAGIYTLKYSKTGFITKKYYNIQFVGGGTLYMGSESIGLIPSITVSQLKIAQSSSQNYIDIQGKISSADSLFRIVGIFFSKSPISVSSVMPYLFGVNAWLQPDSTSFIQTFGIFESERNYYNLSHGTKLYAIACALPRNNWFGGFNPETNTNEIYNSGIMFSNIDSVIVP